MRLLQTLVDRLNANQVKLRQQFAESEKEHGKLQKEWEEALHSLGHSPASLRTRDPTEVSVTLRTREQADARESERQSNARNGSQAGSVVRPRSPALTTGSKTTVTAAKKRVKPNENGSKPPQDAARNAVERQLRLLSKLQKNLGDQHGIDVSALEQVTAQKGKGKGNDKDGKGKNFGKNKGKQNKGYKGKDPGQGRAENQGKNAEKNQH